MMKNIKVVSEQESFAKNLSTTFHFSQTGKRKSMKSKTFRLSTISFNVNGVDCFKKHQKVVPPPKDKKSKRKKRSNKKEEKETFVFENPIQWEIAEKANDENKPEQKERKIRRDGMMRIEKKKRLQKRKYNIFRNRIRRPRKHLARRYINNKRVLNNMFNFLNAGYEGYQRTLTSFLPPITCKEYYEPRLYDVLQGIENSVIGRCILKATNHVKKKSQVTVSCDVNTWKILAYRLQSSLPPQFCSSEEKSIIFGGSRRTDKEYTIGWTVTNDHLELPKLIHYDWNFIDDFGGFGTKLRIRVDSLKLVYSELWAKIWVMFDYSIHELCTYQGKRIWLKKK